MSAIPHKIKVHLPAELAPQLFALLPASHFQNHFELLADPAAAELGLALDPESGNFTVADLSEPDWTPQEFSFEESSFRFRVMKTAHAREPLRDVLKVRGKFCALSVLDGTMGFGVDGFLMTRWGHRVHSFERNPLIYACTAMAWKNYCARHPADAAKMAWTLSFGEPGSQETYDVACLDPMYPEPEQRKALNKKDMRVLAKMIPEAPPNDEELTEWIAKLSKVIRTKIILKRPTKTPEIQPPDGWTLHSQSGASTRFDLYHART